MEEDIKALEKFIKEFETDYNVRWYVSYNTIQAIENLIKRNKDLEEMLKHRIKYTNELEKDLFENASNYVISKSKVREKIEELKNRIKELEGIEGNEEAIEILKLRLQDMIELLQEGDK